MSVIRGMLTTIVNNMSSENKRHSFLLVKLAPSIDKTKNFISQFIDSIEKVFETFLNGINDEESVVSSNLPIFNKYFFFTHNNENFALFYICNDFRVDMEKSLDKIKKIAEEWRISYINQLKSNKTNEKNITVDNNNNSKDNSDKLNQKFVFLLWKDEYRQYVFLKKNLGGFLSFQHMYGRLEILQLNDKVSSVVPLFT